MGKTDKLLEVQKFQPFVPGRRSLKDLQMTENPRANTFSPAFFKVWHDRKVGPGPTVAATARMSTPAATTTSQGMGGCSHSASGGAAKLASHLSWMLCQNLQEKTRSLTLENVFPENISFLASRANEFAHLSV